MGELSDVETARQTPRAVRLPHGVIVRAPGLLPMWYTPAELEQELGVSAHTIREW